MILRCFFILCVTWLMTSCVGGVGRYTRMECELREYIARQPAEIGVAVIIDGVDTVAVNGDVDFPMLSVYKFPIALAAAEHCRSHGIALADRRVVLPEDLHRNTYSPMLNRYGGDDTVSIRICELLALSLQLSDNNASDILLDMAGGCNAVQNYIDGLGFDGINVRWTEADMHRDTDLCYENSSTPLAMASLVWTFEDKFNDAMSVEIKRLMENCGTGADRIVRPLAAENISVGHKTGTGDITADGRLMAVNDVGYVRMAEHRYAIAVFITESERDIEQTSAMIAEISEIVYRNILAALN